MSWQAADGRGSPVTGYEVQWSDDGFSQSIDTYDAAADAESHLIRDLVNGTEYTVRVRAINDVDVGLWSSASATPAALPGEPGDVTIEVQVASLGVSWTAADPGGLRITGYRLQWRAGDDSFTDSDSFVDLGRVLSRRIRSLDNGTEYFVRVRATNAVGDGTWSPAESAIPVARPGEPRNVVAQPRDGALAVSWEPPESGGPVDSYRVRWAGGSSVFSGARSAAVTGLSHVIPNLDNGTEYRVRVAAVNAVGVASAQTVTATPRTAPGPPRALDVRSVSDTLMLSWDPAAADGGSAVTGYRVQWKSGTQEYNETDRQAGPTDPRHVIEDLTEGTEYTVRVAAVNAAGAGAALERSITLDDPPGAPQSPGATPRNRSLEVSWSAPTDMGASPITEYRVFWKGPGDTSFDESVCSLRRIKVPAGTLEGAIGPLANATAYDIRIVAVNDSGPGDAATLTATPVALPGKPVDLTVHAFDGGLQLLWNKPADNGPPITGYRVQWKSGTQQYSSDRQATPAASAESHTINDLDNGTEYTISAVAVNAIGDSRVAEVTATPADTPGKPTGFSSTGRRDCSEWPSLNICDIYGPFEYFVEVTWEAPEAQGASTVTGYRVDWRPSWLTDEYSTQTVTERRAELSVSCYRDWDECVTRWLDVRVSAVNDGGAGVPAEYDAYLRLS